MLKPSYHLLNSSILCGTLFHLIIFKCYISPPTLLTLRIKALNCQASPVRRTETDSGKQIVQI